MNSPHFSVVLVNWNTANLLLRAIESVITEAIQSDICVEIVVVDNGSSDDSVAQIREKHPEIRVIENGANLGFARAVNKALQVHQGRHVMLLNTDAVLQPGCLKSFLDAFQQHTNLGILGADLLHEDLSSQNSSAPFPTLPGELLNKSLLRIFLPRKYSRKVIDHAAPFLKVDSVIGACLVIRKETLDAIGPLDERFFFFFEETDWCFQAHRLGWAVAIIPTARVIHGQGKSSKPVLVDTRIEFYRSRYRYFLKNKGRVRTILLFEGLLIKLSVETLTAFLAWIASAGQSERVRQRLRVVKALLLWHLRGCPRSWGLEGRFLRGSEKDS